MCVASNFTSVIFFIIPFLDINMIIVRGLALHVDIWSMLKGKYVKFISE